MILHHVCSTRIKATHVLKQGPKRLFAGLLLLSITIFTMCGTAPFDSYLRLSV